MTSYVTQGVQGVGSGDDEYATKVRSAMVKAVDWVESLKVPKALKRGDPSEDTPIITGVRDVLFGTQPACEAVTLFGVHPPRYLCYMLSGFICDILQFCIDIFLHVVLHLSDASVCWALGFGGSIVFRHTTHRYLVFGDYVGGYWKSLSRMYAGYSVIIVISTIFNFVMTRYAHFPHYIAWIVTLLWTGIVNYFILKKLWTFGGKEKVDNSTDIEDQTVIEAPSPSNNVSTTDQKLHARKLQQTT